MQQLVKKGILWQWILAVCCVLTVSTSCDDKDPYDPYANFDFAAQAKAEDELIQEYLKLHGITDTVKTASGLYYKKIKEGTGARPVLGDSIRVHYVGYIVHNSQQFESTYSSAKGPAKFKVAQGDLIKGWLEGIPMMRSGEEARLFIPSHLAYGLMGRYPKIQANTTLMFTIELVDVWK